MVNTTAFAGKDIHEQSKKCSTVYKLIPFVRLARGICSHDEPRLRPLEKTVFLAGWNSAIVHVLKPFLLTPCADRKTTDSLVSFKDTRSSKWNCWECGSLDDREHAGRD